MPIARINVAYVFPYRFSGESGVADRLPAMEFLYNVFVFLHFASWALVFGGSIASMRTKALYKGVSHGAMGAVETPL